jgi:hypothetical protein
LITENLYRHQSQTSSLTLFFFPFRLFLSFSFFSSLSLSPPSFPFSCCLYFPSFLRAAPLIPPVQNTLTDPFCLILYSLSPFRPNHPSSLATPSHSHSLRPHDSLDGSTPPPMFTLLSLSLSQSIPTHQSRPSLRASPSPFPIVVRTVFPAPSEEDQPPCLGLLLLTSSP